MPTVDERVAHVEGQVNELSLRLSGVEGAIRHLEQRMDIGFETLDRRIDTLDVKVSRQFMWLVGIQVTTLAALAAALISRSS
jgi:hypothetical protein